MQKLKALLKENKTILAVTLLVALLTAVNLLLPSGPAKEPDTGAELPAAGAELDADAIIISEFMPKNGAVLPDSEGSFPDWVELCNISDRSVSLEGWKLSDRADKEGWSFPAVSLEPGERLIVFASGKDSTAELHADFSLSEGETLSLKNKYGYPVASYVCPETGGSQSCVPMEDGSISLSLYPSPGFPETPEGYELYQESLSVSSSLIINEVQTANFSSSGNMPRGTDWVEIKNISGAPIELSEYSLSDDEDDYERWRFPVSEILPGEKKLIYCDAEVEPGVYDGRIYADFSLNSSSEQLFLSKNGTLMDYVSLRDIPYLCSYGRLDGENGWFFMSRPSPGEQNSTGSRRVSAAPQVISGDGVLNGVSSTELIIEAPGSIYYTTDGSAPDENSISYSEAGPPVLTETGIVRAIAFENGALPSRVLDISCILNENHSLPVMSLVSASEEDFDGMYSGGVKNLELPGSLSLYEEDSRFTVPCGIRIHGETSRILPKKNMSVRFRGAYGQDTLHYDVYGGGVTDFTNFVLRSGQDYYSAVLRNELCQNLCLAASDSVISQRSKYCVLYINGRYSGIYSLMEKPNEQHYASLAGVSRESVTVMESEVPFDSEIYQSVFLLCARNDMSLKENYDKLCSVLDVDSLIDWIIMEGFCANNDLTYGNLRYCRSTEDDGKWRLMFYDLDSTLYREELVFDVLSGYALSTRQVSGIIAPLMKNEEFRDRLLSRAGELFRGPLSSESVLSELERLAAQLEPEIPRDYSRYGMTLEKWQWNINFIRSMFADGRWNSAALERLCDIFYVSNEEREEYFG